MKISRNDLHFKFAMKILLGFFLLPFYNMHSFNESCVNHIKINDKYLAVVQQPDNQLLISAIDEKKNILSIDRYTPEGLLASSFEVAKDPALVLLSDCTIGLTTQDDNKIVVAIFSSNEDSPSCSIRRYNQNGTIDSSFNMLNIPTEHINFSIKELPHSPAVGVFIAENGNITAVKFDYDIENPSAIIRCDKDGKYVSEIGADDLAAIPNFTMIDMNGKQDQIIDMLTSHDMQVTKKWNFHTRAPFAITIAPITLSKGKKDSAYSQQFTAAGGTAPYTFTSTGNLPLGMTLSTAGLLAGLPNTAGTYNFTIIATDSTSASISQAYTLVICETLTVIPNTQSLPNATVGKNYTAQFGVNQGTAPYTYILTGSIPTGFTFSAQGLLTGTPAVAAVNTYSFTITATDANGCTGATSYTLSVTCPTISFDSNTLPAGVVGEQYKKQLDASGGTPAYTYTVSSGSLPTGLTLSTTGLLSGSPLIANVGSYDFTLTATDANGCKGDQNYTLAISCPSITFDTAPLLNGKVGTPYNQQIDATGGTLPYTYSVSSGSLPAGLVLSSAGLISGTPLITGIGSYDITLSLIDANGCKGEQNYTLAISCPAIVLDTASLPNATIGSAYFEQLDASGGLPAYTYLVTSGSLPSGLTLTSTGVISGTPLIANSGAYNFTITATDQNGCKGDQNYSITIACPSITLDTVSLANGIVGKAYNKQLDASGGSAPYTYSITSGTLPTGLVLTAAGVISGTPTVAAIGSYDLTISATDANGCKGEHNYSLVISCPAMTMLPASLPEVVIGTRYTQQLNADGGKPSYTYAITSGSIPTSITLTTAGLLSANATIADVGTYQFTVTTTDANACTTSKEYALIISSPIITLQPTTLENGIVGVLFNEQLNAKGGSAPYTYTITSGLLPIGLSLTATGLLAGTPTIASVGSYNFTVTTTDTNGSQGSQSYTISIECPTIAIKPNTLPNALIGSPYVQQLNAAGGIAPYQFSLTSGDLPDSFAITTNGLLTGQPTMADLGNYSFSLMVTDANHCQTVQDYSVTVSCPLITLDPNTLPNGVIGTPYISKGIIATGGKADYTFTVEGSLPQGLQIDSATGALSGTPDLAGMFTFMIIATDANGCEGVQTYTITIACSTITMLPTEQTLTNGQAGIQFPEMQFTTLGGVAPYIYTVAGGALPTGLTLSSNGRLSGTPTTAGTYYFTINATDIDGCQIGQVYTTTIVNTNISVVPYSMSALATKGSSVTRLDGIDGELPEATIENPYALQLSAAFGSAPYTFEIVSGALPAGLVMTIDGLISGEATQQGTYYFTVLTTDDAGIVNQSMFKLVATCPTITILPMSAILASGQVGVVYSNVQFSATAAADFTVISGALPDGMSLSTVGLLSGTPTKSGQYNFAISAEVGNCSTIKEYSLYIAPSNSLLSSSVDIAGAIRDKYC